jgi:hypothetical protein
VRAGRGRRGGWRRRRSARRIDETHDRVAGHRFAGARFADEAHHLALAHDERHVVDRLYHARPREEMGAQAGDLEQRRAHRLQPRIQHVAQLIGDEIDADDRAQERDAGKEADPVLAGQRYW